MSIKGTIYKEISALLMQQVEGLAWVDQDRGQLENIDTSYAIPFPAVVLKFLNGQYTNEGSGMQKGDITLRVKIGYENFADAFDGSVNQDIALAYFDFMELVHNVLEGAEGTYFAECTRVAEGEDEPNGPLLIEWVNYQIKVTDNSAYIARNSQIVTPDPTITVTKQAVPEQEEEIGGLRFQLD